MRRFTLLLPFALCLVASPAYANHETGSVILSIVHPTIPRELHNRGIDSNVIGVVFEIPASAKNQTYTLTRTSGFGNLDIYFYGDDEGDVGATCTPIPVSDDSDLNPTTESGPICPGPVTPGWAIVVLRFGLNAGFNFHYT